MLMKHYSLLDEKEKLHSYNASPNSILHPLKTKCYHNNESLAKYIAVSAAEKVEQHLPFERFVRTS